MKRARCLSLAGIAPLALALLAGCGSNGGEAGQLAGGGGERAGAAKGGAGTGGSSSSSGGAAGRGAGGSASTPDGSAGDAPASTEGDAGGPRAAVVISEIMFNPFFEHAAEDFHEFVEIHNKGTAAVRLSGWKLGGNVKFTFPDNATIAPASYLVIAKNRAKLAAVAKYGLKEADLLGDYTGELGNGKKNSIAVLDAAGRVIDSVPYSADFPWPMGADSLGLAPSWVPEAGKHQYMGRSLERISLEAPSAAVDTWEASALDGATPGKANSVAGMPKAVVIEQSAKPKGSAAVLISPADRVIVQARFSEGGMVSDVSLEYFADDVARTDEKPVAAPMTNGAMFWEAELPVFPANSIVRYRFLGKRGGATAEVISPRATDPNPWHAYFVNPNAPGKTRAYHIFVSPTDWGNMWRYVEPGWVEGCLLGEHPECTKCAVNQKWNESVPGVFVSDGRVYDVRTRYQGGKFARLAGRNLRTWSFPRPNYGHMPTFQALGWKVDFPRYNRFEGVKAIKLNKRSQMCTGIPDVVAARVFESVGIPEPKMRYARMYVNGGYYLYAMEIEDMDENFLQRGFPNQAIGDLFECNSVRWDEGPWGWGDFRLLKPFCGYTEVERYAWTYERGTLGWKDNAEFIALLKGLHTARAAGVEAVKKYFDDNFDRDKVMRYVAVINWAGAWDDDYHNYDLYKPPGGKWMLLSTDLNRLLTGVTVDVATGVSTLGNVNQSLYLGKQGEPFNWGNRWHYLKDSFLTVFKTEYDELLKKLAQNELNPTTIGKYVDEAAAAFEPMEAAAALSSGACDAAPPQVMEVKNFVQGRYKIMKNRLMF